MNQTRSSDNITKNHVSMSTDCQEFGITSLLFRSQCRYNQAKILRTHLWNHFLLTSIQITNVATPSCVLASTVTSTQEL